MQELILELLTMASLLSGYAIPATGVPQVEFMSYQQLAQVHSDHHQAKLKEGNYVLGLYSRESKKVLLSDEFDTESIYDKAILLHELVHYLQDVNGAYEGKWKYSCSQPDEVEAYTLEAKYLESSGADKDKVKSLKLQAQVFSLCVPPYMR